MFGNSAKNCPIAVAKLLEGGEGIIIHDNPRYTKTPCDPTVPKDLQVVVLFDVPEVEGNQSDRFPQLFFQSQKVTGGLSPWISPGILKGRVLYPGWWLTYPSENMKVSWDHYCQYMEK